MPGPFLDQAGLGALVANIKNGFLSSEISYFNGKVTYSSDKQQDIPLTPTWTNLVFYTEGWDCRIFGDGLDVEYRDDTIMINKSGLLFLTANIVVKSATDKRIEIDICEFRYPNSINYSSELCYHHIDEKAGTQSFNLSYFKPIEAGSFFKIHATNWDDSSGYIDSSGSRVAGILIPYEIEVVS